MSTVKDEAIKLRQNIDAVYEAGLKKVWGDFTDKGNRTRYSYLFYGFIISKDTFCPMFDIRPTAADYMFFQCAPPMNKPELYIDMEELEKRQNIVFDFSGCTELDRTFAGSPFKVINVIDASNVTNFIATFYGGYSERLERINKLILSEKAIMDTNTFQYADYLHTIGFEGVIASEINLASCPLNVESAKKAILCLKDFTGTDKEFTYKISFSSTTISLLEAEGATAPNGDTWLNYAQYAKCWNV